MISVCMATYNGQKYIHEQLASILPQLGDDDEVIISDDGSTDGTLDIIAAFDDRRITILHHKPFQGAKYAIDRPTHNFENALRQAKGEYIFLSDQDDVWLPSKVAKMMTMMKDYDLIISDAILVDKDLHTLHHSNFECLHATRRGVIRNIIRCTNQGCCMSFHRRVLECALPFPPIGVGHDVWLGLVADMFFRALLLRVPLVLYRRTNNNVTPYVGKNQHSLWFKISYRRYIIAAVIKKWFAHHI